MDRKYFLRKLAEKTPTRLEQAIALLWYYEQFQYYTERSVADLVKDISEDGFGAQSVSKLRARLLDRRNKLTVRGSSKDTFRINSAFFSELTNEYGPIVNVRNIEVSSSVIPHEYISSTNVHLERLVNQINGAYDYGFYDAAAVILRRLMESLIIEIYIKEKRTNEIRNNNIFFQLSGLVSKISNDQSIIKSRSLSKGLDIIKDIGDTAAHDRTYITPPQDIDDNKIQIRKVINELLMLAGIK